VFTAEITALLTALRFVGSGQPGEFLILTDSLSSIEAIEAQGLILSSMSVRKLCGGCERISLWFG
jgi:ribonuclease HI